MMQKKVQAIIYTEEKGKKKYLILHRKLHWVGWEFLKETIKPKESYEETIRRGIQEEIGVTNITIEKEKPIQIKINETTAIIYVYMIKVDAKEKIDITKEVEHDDYKWVTKEEAKKLLTYDDAKKLLEEF